METLRDDGRITHLGLANFTRDRLEAARRVADAPLVTDQVLYNPYKDQFDLRRYCHENDVSLTAYSPLARGAVLDDPTLESIGAEYDKTAAQVALRWLVQQEGVVAIPKATGEDHLRDNLAVFDFSLTEAEMNRIHEVSPGLKQRLLNRLPGLMRRNPLP